MINKLRAILTEVKIQSGRDFSGVGLIVCENTIALPILPLRNATPQLNDKNIVASLLKLSSFSCEYHDGFHILSEDFQLTDVSQYFSPPIVNDVEIDRSKRFGGRYIAALFGSSLPEVMLTGIASNGFGVAIFQGGKEIFFAKDL